METLHVIKSVQRFVLQVISDWLGTVRSVLLKETNDEEEMSRKCTIHSLKWEKLRWQWRNEQECSASNRDNASSSQILLQTTVIWELFTFEIFHDKKDNSLWNWSSSTFSENLMLTKVFYLRKIPKLLYMTFKWEKLKWQQKSQDTCFASDGERQCRSLNHFADSSLG